MTSSQIETKGILITLYQDIRTVFRLSDVAMICGISDFNTLNTRMNYYVRTGKILNPRKGIYAKPAYSKEELAGLIFTPCYI